MRFDLLGLFAFFVLIALVLVAFLIGPTLYKVSVKNKVGQEISQEKLQVSQVDLKTPKVENHGVLVLNDKITEQAQNIDEKFRQEMLVKLAAMQVELGIAKAKLAEATIHNDNVRFVARQFLKECQLNPRSLQCAETW